MSLKIYITILKRKTSLDVILKHKTPSSFSGLITARAEINSTLALPVIARAWLRHWPYMVPRASGIGSQPCLIAINTSKFPHGPAPNKHRRVLSVYVLKANSLAKPHAKEQLLADLQSYQIDVAIISETKFKKHHKPQFSELPGYRTVEIGSGGAVVG